MALQQMEDHPEGTYAVVQIPKSGTFTSITSISAVVTLIVESSKVKFKLHKHCVSSYL